MEKVWKKKNNQHEMFPRGSLLPSFYIYIFSLFHLLVFHSPLLWSLLYKLELRTTQQEEVAILLAPVEIITIVIGFILNGVVSYKIRDNRRSGRRF